MITIIPPIRGDDKWGNGKFGAPRGDRTHNGVDIACCEGSVILSPVDGVVTKIGFPYSPEDAVKGHMRYVEVMSDSKYKHRFFYVLPTVDVGENIKIGDELGISQDIDAIYEGITPHIHYEIKYEVKEFLDPTKYLFDNT